MNEIEVNNNIFSSEGRIHRMNYFIIILITNFLFIVSSEYFNGLASEYSFYSFDLGVGILAFIILIASVYVQICATIKRLRDIKFNPWFVLIALIPIVALIVTLPCLFIKSEWD